MTKRRVSLKCDLAPLQGCFLAHLHLGSPLHSLSHRHGPAGLSHGVTSLPPPGAGGPPPPPPHSTFCPEDRRIPVVTTSDRVQQGENTVWVVCPSTDAGRHRDTWKQREFLPFENSAFSSFLLPDSFIHQTYQI